MKDHDLLEKFDALIVEGQDRYSNYIKSHDELRRCLVRVYLWWAESNQYPDVIQAIEKQHGMPVVKLDGNKPAFTNLLRLIFGKTEAYDKEYVKVWQWGTAISALHEEFTEHPQRYRNNPEGTLLKFFNDKGGISGLLKKDVITPTADDVLPSTKSSKSSIKTTSQSTKKAIKQQAIEWLETAAGIGTAASNSPVRVDYKGYVAMLARREPDGTITLLGSTNDYDAVSTIAEKMLSTQVAHLPNSLRLLVEIIRSQTYPANALPQNLDNRTKWYRTVLLDQSPIRTSDLPNYKIGDQKKALWAPSKLLIRGKQKDIILSNSKSGVSVVTRCVPKHFLLTNKDEVFLRVVERNRVERLVETGEMQITAATPEITLKRSKKTEKFCYELALTNKHAKRPLTLHFYDTKPYAGSMTGFQADFDFTSFKPIWTFSVEPHWFGAFREKMLDKWFTQLGSGNRPNRANNRHMEVTVTVSEFELLFNISDYGKANDRMPANISFSNKSDKLSTCYLSKDIGPVLFNLADVVCNKQIEVKGNEDAIVFEYENDIGRFHIAVPCAVPKGKKMVRKSSAFSDYRYA